jgi:osmoprotectant transport system substrate-binding protein
MFHRAKISAALLGVALLGVAACGGDNSSSSGSSSSVTIGSANFPENILLMQIYGQALAAKGINVSYKPGVGTREIVFPALQKGDLTLTPEYTNSLLTYLLKQKNQTPSAKNVQEQVDALKQNLPGNLTVLTPSAAEDKDVIVCNKTTEDKYGFKTLTDLSAKSSEIVLGGPPEFQTRGGLGLQGLQTSYGAKFKEFKPLDTAGPVTVAALKDNTVNCANLFSTDPSISANTFTSLTDDKTIVPNEAVLPLIAKASADNKTISDALNAVSAKLDTPGLEQLVAKVVTDKADPAQVAKDWLAQNGFTK